MSEMISNSCEKQKELIIAEIKSFTDDICLSSENKLFLTVKLVELCHEALCRERQKKVPDGFVLPAWKEELTVPLIGYIVFSVIRM